MRYTIKSQACPLCPHCTGAHHRGARPTSRTPHPGGKTLGGTYYEENFPAQEAPAQAGPRLSDPYEHQDGRKVINARRAKGRKSLTV